jgi:glycosyltransferase
LKISIVTVSYQSAATIERTLKSVEEQTYTNLEHVIVDGGSKDETVQIVRRHPSRLGAVISERDGGIYDAMNKGVALAKGDYLLFLNSDDWLVGPDAIADAVKSFDPKSRMQHGRLLFHHRTGVATSMGGPVTPTDLRFQLKNFHQPACFFHRDLFKDYGVFNTEYRISADYDLMRRFLTKEPSHFLNVDVTNMADAGASAVQNMRGITECLKISRSFGESWIRTGIMGQWTRFWLFLRYQYPALFWPVKNAKDWLSHLLSTSRRSRTKS